ncbi:MAG: ABC transporter ATP-binding protein [Phycisphaerales bacterium]|nr:ABC transporter ATP-binding protein [Phycisphaerales bacterium]
MADQGFSTSDSIPVVECRRLTKVFKDFWMRDRARAVDDLSFDVNPREIFGLLGPNGSGKSTTIKIMLGLLRPTSGRVGIFGRPPADVGVKKRIGYLPEESYLYQFLNARETLEYYGKLFHLDRRVRERRIDELLDMVGLTHAQFRPVREYSKGMQRRIGLAQALINDPDLLILDEPTTGLDPIGTRQVKDLILELGRRGKTVILSSHLLADVEDVVDRMIILYGGKKRDEGSCDGLLTRKNLTTIESDELDDETVSRIDELIRARSGGQKSIRKVTKPRQKLEELFLGIVERAQAERASTSGAMHGGATAAFLRGEEESKEGQELIESLVRDEAPARSVESLLAEASSPVPSQASAEQKRVIESLMQDDQAEMPATAKRPASPPSKVPEDVDRSVIDALLDDGGEEKRP